MSEPLAGSSTVAALSLAWVVPNGARARGTRGLSPVLARNSSAESPDALLGPVLFSEHAARGFARGVISGPRLFSSVEESNQCTAVVATYQEASAGVLEEVLVVVLDSAHDGRSAEVRARASCGRWLLCRELRD